MQHLIYLSNTSVCSLLCHHSQLEQSFTNLYSEEQHLLVLTSFEVNKNVHLAWAGNIVFISS